jgi:hypothetical protein
VTAVTAEAITAAFDAVGNREPIPSLGTMKRILDAAAPHIRAQVYAEIHQLAERRGAVYPHSIVASGPLAGQSRTAPFADLIPRGETDG